VRRLLLIIVVTTVAWAGTASAAGGAAVVTKLTPNRISAASTASVSITGLSAAGLPSSVELLLQRGFSTSAKSVSVLCKAGQASSSTCPSASQIGTAAAGVSLFGTPLAVPLKLFLSEPSKAGDIASVILSGSEDGISLNVSGRLFVPRRRGLELLFAAFPSAPVTLDSLAFYVHATRTTTSKGKREHGHRKTVKTQHSLITNPSSCTGSWTGTVTLSYSSGSESLPFSAPCKKPSGRRR